MVQHGYLRDYDESSYRGDDRDRWRDEDRERNWRTGDRHERERERDFMFRAREREESPESSRFREEDRQWRGRQDRFGASREEARIPERFSIRQDDHYRSWRRRQIAALDREYEDYCREREQQFHRDFDSWRSDRRNQGSSETEATDTELELTEDRAIGRRGNTPSPVDQATLGNSNSENSKPGSGKRPA